MDRYGISDTPFLLDNSGINSSGLLSIPMAYEIPAATRGFPLPILPCTDPWDLKTWLLATNCPSFSSQQNTCSSPAEGEVAQGRVLSTRHTQQRCLVWGADQGWKTAATCPHSPKQAVVVAAGDAGCLIGCCWVT